MIAGEEPDMGMRLRRLGWRLLRIDVEMAVHDAALARFGQWWRRARRSGHAYGELAFRHPDACDPNWPHSVRSIAAWGGVMPTLLLVAMMLALTVNRSWWIAAALLLLPWPLRMLQVAERERRGLGMSAPVHRVYCLWLPNFRNFSGCSDIIVIAYRAARRA